MASVFKEEDAVQTAIAEPSEVDVLCGRGGAALRHPGNQSYRQLVNLNKELYTISVKTEKLKISRSIVSAIRELKGRFLERNTDHGTWYDIGDKKAVEKTSQALREGQPKLRQKIEEMEGAKKMEQDDITDNSSEHFDVIAIRDQELRIMLPQMPDPKRKDKHVQMLRLLGQQSLYASGEDALDQDRINQFRDFQFQLHQQQHKIRSLCPTLTQRQTVPTELGLTDSHLSLLSEFSAFQSGESLMSVTDSILFRHVCETNLDRPVYSKHANDAIGNLPFSENVSSLADQEDMQQHQNIKKGLPQINEKIGFHQASTTSGNAGYPPQVKIPDVDPRHAFAKMKYFRPSSARNRSAGNISLSSFGDGMPNIHMVESSISLSSDLSHMTECLSRLDLQLDPYATEAHAHLSRKLYPERSTVFSHNEEINLPRGSAMGCSSIMSGLSRIDDDLSMISDVSKKICSESSMSVALTMSEIFDLKLQGESNINRKDYDTQEINSQIKFSATSHEPASLSKL